MILPGVHGLRPRVSLMNSQHTSVEDSLTLGNVDRLKLKAWVNASQAQLNGVCRRSYFKAGVAKHFFSNSSSDDIRLKSVR